MKNLKNLTIALLFSVCCPLFAKADPVVVPKITSMSEFSSRSNFFNGYAFLLNDDSSGMVVDDSGMVNFKDGHRTDLTNTLRAATIITSDKYIQVLGAVFKEDKKKLAIKAAVANNPDYLEKAGGSPWNYYSVVIAIDVSTFAVDSVNRVSEENFEQFLASNGFPNSVPRNDNLNDYILGRKNDFMTFQPTNSSKVYVSSVRSQGEVLENSASVVIVDGWRKQIYFYSKDKMPQ